MEQSAWTYEALPKTVLYAAVLFSVGTSVCRWMATTVIHSSLVLAELDRTLERFALSASSLAFAALWMRMFGHTAMVFGAPDALHGSNLHVIAIESRWGQAWRLQVLSAAVLVMCAFTMRFARRTAWVLYTTAVLILCATIPRLGHGATSTGHLLLHTLHLVGVSLWLGTLSVIVGLYFRKAGAPVAVLLERFSRIALPAAGLTVLTGVIAAAIYVDSFSNLFTTSYGRTLLVKVAGFGAILACGWSNWRRLRTGQAPRGFTLIAEIVFAAAVIVVTGVLTETEHP